MQALHAGRKLRTAQVQDKSSRHVGGVDQGQGQQARDALARQVAEVEAVLQYAQLGHSRLKFHFHRHQLATPGLYVYLNKPVTSKLWSSSFSLNTNSLKGLFSSGRILTFIGKISTPAGGVFTWNTVTDLPLFFR